MLNNISPNQIFWYLLVTIAMLLVLLLLEFSFANAYFPQLTLVAIGLVITAFCFLIYRKLIINFQDNRKELRGGFQQMQPLLFLQQTLPLRAALPPLRSFAASPDVLAFLVEISLNKRPKTIVEIGGGVSTLVHGYTLQKLGCGKVYAIDHDAHFTKITQQNIAKHGLIEYAEVIHAPLKKHIIKGESWQWYEVDLFLNKIEKIDILFVDGPPFSTQKNARYPALPLLLERLSDDAIILIDDCIRAEDKATVKRWLAEYPQFVGEYHWLEKGAIVLRRKSA